MQSKIGLLVHQLETRIMLQPQLTKAILGPTLHWTTEDKSPYVLESAISNK